ncbi:plexin-A4-like isoform X2 [Saccostrea echinata]|uniref:plexin-A4-like isoform X2 n=1 Tax=Saccostrea echinata TaxID=191078 RepID=UPI002A7F90C0|nr:plexin-A4-like isoform X2 [Saccostrea echinata]
MKHVIMLILWKVISLTISITSAASVIRELKNPNPKDEFSLMSKYGADMIIVGGTNYIHRVFSRNLSIEISEKIGPKLDNPDCLNLEKVTCSKELYNSYVKALLINKKKEPQQDEIIICTSLFQGSCDKRNASTLELLPKSYPQTVNPVVANNKTATTVAFLAPGPKDTTAMYVGASWTNTGLRAIRGLVPAFSSRNTEDFQFTHSSIATKSYTMLDEINKDSFPIRYIYGFASGNFSYVGTIQKTSVAAEGYISKLIRVCLFDEHFYSYAETALECIHNGKTYNLLQTAYVSKPGIHLAAALQIPEDEDVLFGMFGHGNPNDLIKNSGESVLCIYPMRYVKQVFTRNIKTCFEGIGRTGPDHIATPNNCQKTALDIGDDYCGQYDFNNPISGPEAVKTDIAISINATASSLIVTTTNAGYTVAFVGTKTGHIKKIAVESGINAKEYKDMAVESGSLILKNMFFDDDKRHLFVLTPKKLLKLVVQSCSQYTTCEECRGAKDPYCGWCSLANKCTLAQDCSEYTSPLKWMGYNGETCTKITQVYPDKIQKDNKLTKTTTLTLNISNLPTYNGSYKCAFEGYDKKIETVATRTSANVVKCNTPMPNELPPFPTGTDHITMRLSIIIMEINFVSANFTFFDCEVHTKHSCYRCTSSSFNCTWCIKNHLCTHHPVIDCSSNDDFISGQNSAGISIPHESGPNFCPSIDPSKQQNILVPSGIEKTITLNLIKLKSYQRPIKCAFAFNSQTEPQGEIAEVFVMPVVVMIRCKKTRFFYPGDSESYNVPMKILWGDKYPKPLDNPHNVQVIMYKCENMADTCGECLTQKEEYTCGWCKKTNQCSLQSSCVSPNSSWLPNTSNCPNPIITRIYPLTGPKEGGTLLTIEGRDLGKSYEDIVSNVDIAGVQCSPIRKEYVESKKIVCTTGRFIGKEERSDKVRVTVALKLTAVSKQHFTYVDPEITDITPAQGPKSGGTQVTIFGKNLDCGTERKAYFGRTEYECRLDNQSITRSRVTCETARANKTLVTEELYMMFDNQLVKSDLVYKYVEDPNVTEVDRKVSIVSGGLKVLVKGNGFLPIQNSSPKMVFYSPDPLKSPYYGECQVRDDVTMECSTPQVEPALITKKPHSQDQQGLAFGFIIDNVQNIRNFSASHNEFFQICPDPDISVFPNDKIKSFQWKSNEFLTISGINLDQLRLEKDDVVIKIGKSECNITSTGRQLTCRPPKARPTPMKGGQYPEVEVTIGKNLTFFVGYLKYEETDLALPLEYIILISVGGGVLILSVIVVIIMYRMKSKKNNSMMRKMQIQMDNLESKVAKECKEAFVVLQTDIDQLMNDYMSGNNAIPFWDYRSYCMRVLFPQDGDTNHPVIKDLEVEYSRRDNVEKGLKLFSQLISNKTFLLIFVRTLEGHKQFKMRDRVNVASLISVALQTKMEYATDILKTLLAELIEKSVDGKNHPKLLLRRTESVAEKMLTNWFTFLLYKFLKDCAGEPLFLLYQAMKKQVSKGPVDMVTSEARFSLSEDKLIRQQLDYRQMEIFVTDLHEFASPIPVRVLDCDTITQVKEKILDVLYKHVPYSSRPVKEDVDLVLYDKSAHTTEWANMNKGGRLILQDDDSTTRVEGEYKRLNTLSHYKVPDEALMSLVEKQPPSYNNLSLTNSEKSTRFYENVPFYTRSPSLNRSISPQDVHIGLDNYGVKYYHLVKPHDSDPTGDGNRGSKMVSEIYLTRLLATKGTLQQYVDDLFERIFSTAHRGTVLPLAIKYMFDFLDDQALLHNIMDTEVVHTWKSNSLPLRFWVNVIKNPNFVFDIYKSNIVDSCLSVVAQTFMDSCSMSEHRLGINSPSSKLLYAKDIPKYKKWVERYYQDIKMMPAISDQDMTALLTDESRQHADDFNTTAALYELYKYIQQYYEDIMMALEEDEFAKKNRLTYKLEQVRHAMDSELYC